MTYQPTWAVVATVDEPPALVQAFVAWYLHLGATEVIVYFDRPDDPAANVLDAVPGVTVIRCDLDHWQRLGRKRPAKHQIRQLRNATDAYGRVKADWLLHVDADEFVLGATDMLACLNRIDPSADCAVVPVAERVYPADIADASVFEGAFRRPFRGEAQSGRALFGADYDLTGRGLTGHAIGKSFARVGRDMQISIHRPRRTGDQQVMSVSVTEVELLHFDGLTPLYWVYKLLRKADAFAHHGGMVPSPHRQRQIDAVLAAPEAAFALHDRLKRVDDGRRDTLLQLGLWVEAAFDPTAALSRIWPEHSIDLSPDAVDSWLWERNGSLLSGYGINRRP